MNAQGILSSEMFFNK